MRNLLPVGLGLLTVLAALVAAAWMGRGDAAPTADDSGLASSVWGADYFPDVTLTAHDGRRLRFFEDMIEDRVVLINFIYTSCPDTCPLETARLLEVEQLLGDRLGEDVFFYSISIDPEHDTQPVLAEFADSWDIPEGWLFLTGDHDDITLLREKLGVSTDDVDSLDLADHDLHLVLGNQATGRWMKRSPFENSHVLADQLGRWLHNWDRPGPGDRDFADAPKLRQISTGEDLFRTRCQACHTIGGGDLRDTARRQVGPDLYHVADKRDADWLRRWLREPDVMLEEGDPTAVAMRAAFNGVPMPNFRLSDREVTQLLGYIDRESRRLDRVRGVTAGADGHGGHGGHDAHGGHAPARAEAGGHGAGHGDHAGHGAAEGEAGR